MERLNDGWFHQRLFLLVFTNHGQDPTESLAVVITTLRVSIETHDVRIWMFWMM